MDTCLAKTKLFFFLLEANTTCDGDKESDGEDVEADNGNSSEDLRKVITISSSKQEVKIKTLLLRKMLRFLVHA